MNKSFEKTPFGKIVLGILLLIIGIPSAGAGIGILFIIIAVLLFINALK
jgi:hypothetical protein|tara:strand:- start:363 stop:509 length:147 start_codon:yes stop_codon:yes gene_type:complete